MSVHAHIHSVPRYRSLSVSAGFSVIVIVDREHGTSIGRDLGRDCQFLLSMSSYERRVTGVFCCPLVASFPIYVQRSFELSLCRVCYESYVVV